MARKKTRTTECGSARPIDSEALLVQRRIWALPDDEIARRLGVSIYMLRARAKELGIKRRTGVPPDPLRARLDELRALIAAKSSAQQVTLLESVNDYLRREHGLAVRHAKPAVRRVL